MHSPPDRCSGGAPKFMEFIVSELLPRLEAKYPVDPERLGLFGVSAGGFFASWAIFQPNSPFRAYIIQSPAMAYGDGEIFRLEQRYAGEHKDLKVGIYLASGSLEMADPYLEGMGQIVSGQVRLAAALAGRHYPGLKLYTEILPGLSHGDAAGTALVRGIRLLYGKEGVAPWQR
jgi:predicted alpha/beta superfamily hydrolase